MSAFTSAVMLRNWTRDREFLPWVIVVTMVTLTFFLEYVHFLRKSIYTFLGNTFWRTNRSHVPAGRIRLAHAAGW